MSHEVEENYSAEYYNQLSLDLERKKAVLIQKKEAVDSALANLKDGLKNAYILKRWHETRKETSAISGGDLDAWYGFNNDKSGVTMFSCFSRNPKHRSEDIHLSNGDAIALRDYLISLDLGDAGRETELTGLEDVPTDNDESSDW